MKNRMLALKEMVDLVNRYKRKQLEVLGYSPDSEGLYEAFYSLLADREIETDEEAAKKLLNATADDVSYKRLKNDFKKRITNTVFFIDLKDAEFNDAQKAFYNSWKYVAAVKILSGRGARNSAIELSKKALKAALKYELTEPIIEFARILKHYYAYAEGDLKEWKNYDKIVKDNLNNYQLEIIAESYAQELFLPFVKSRSSKPHLEVKAKKYIEFLKPHIHTSKSFKLQLLYFRICLFEKFSIHDYQSIAEISRTAIEFFQNKSFEAKNALLVFYQSLVLSLTVVKNFEEAENAINSSYRLCFVGNINWYKGRLQHLTLKFYSKKYNEAFDIFTKATKHKGFEKLPQIDRELWKIQEGYIHLLIKAEKIDFEGARKKPKPFRLQRFLNEFSEATKDKRGLNVPLQILQTLFLLFERDFDKVEDKIKALGKYAKRHIGTGDEGFRTSVFIQMLQKMSNGGFQATKFEKETNKLLEDMSNSPVMLMNQAHEVEYLPYEEMWNLAKQAVRSF